MCEQNKTTPTEVRDAVKVLLAWRKEKLGGYITCVGCGKTVFAVFPKRKRWCSVNCKMKHYMRNKKSKAAGATPQPSQHTNTAEVINDA